MHVRERSHSLNIIYTGSTTEIEESSFIILFRVTSISLTLLQENQGICDLILTKHFTCSAAIDAKRLQTSSLHEPQPPQLQVLRNADTLRPDIPRLKSIVGGACGSVEPPASVGRLNRGDKTFEGRAGIRDNR